MEDVMEILAGACHLQMSSAIQICCNFLESEINTKTCVDIVNIAEMFSLQKVKSKALKFLEINFEKISELDQYFRLGKDHLVLLIQSNNLNCLNELNLFHKILKWVSFDREGRMTFSTELCSYIRFSLMQPEQLVDQVSGTHIMTNIPECRAFLEEALHYQLLPNRQVLMQTSRSQVRNKPSLVAFGGRIGNHVGYKYNSNKMYALYEDQWIPLQDTDSNFLYAAVAVVDNYLYVCGGMGKPAHARATCQRYDPRTGIWTRLNHMNLRRQSFPLVPYNHTLYAFGGGTPVGQTLEHPPTDSCEMYSIERNEWRLITPLPDRRKSVSACELNGNIYVSGGRTETDTKSCFWCYNICDNNWEDLPDMLIPHAGHAMFPVNKKLYVMDRNTGSTECYDPQVKYWTKLVSPVTVISGVARPASVGPWVYFISYAHGDKEKLCKRCNVITGEIDHLPEFPQDALCVISTSLVIPQSALTNNNSADL